MCIITKEIIVKKDRNFSNNKIGKTISLYTVTLDHFLKFSHKRRKCFTYQLYPAVQFYAINMYVYVLYTGHDRSHNAARRKDQTAVNAQEQASIYNTVALYCSIHILSHQAYTSLIWICHVTRSCDPHFVYAPKSPMETLCSLALYRKAAMLELRNSVFSRGSSSEELTILAMEVGACTGYEARGFPAWDRLMKFGICWLGAMQVLSAIGYGLWPVFGQGNCCIYKWNKNKVKYKTYDIKRSFCLMYSRDITLPCTNTPLR